MIYVVLVSLILLIFVSIYFDKWKFYVTNYSILYSYFFPVGNKTGTVTEEMPDNWHNPLFNLVLELCDPISSRLGRAFLEGGSKS